MSDQSNREDWDRTNDQLSNRAPENEGVRGPFADDQPDGHTEHSIFDGAGNETVVVTTLDADGRKRQGTGPTSEKAMKDAMKGADPIGSGFGSKPDH